MNSQKSTTSTLHLHKRGLIKSVEKNAAGASFHSPLNAKTAFYEISSMLLLVVRYLPDVLMGFLTFLQVAPVLYRYPSIGNNRHE